MPELSPTVFGLIVIALVSLLVIIPRVRNRSHHPTQHEMYFGDQAAARPAAPGAPRATSPTRMATDQPVQGKAEPPAPLKLPH